MATAPSVCGLRGEAGADLPGAENPQRVRAYTERAKGVGERGDGGFRRPSAPAVLGLRRMVRERGAMPAKNGGQGLSLGSCQATVTCADPNWWIRAPSQKPANTTPYRRTPSDCRSRG